MSSPKRNPAASGVRGSFSHAVTGSMDSLRRAAASVRQSVRSMASANVPRSSGDLNGSINNVGSQMLGPFIGSSFFPTRDAAFLGEAARVTSMDLEASPGIMVDDIDSSFDYYSSDEDDEFDDELSVNQDEKTTCVKSLMSIRSGAKITSSVKIHPSEGELNTRPAVADFQSVDSVAAHDRPQTKADAALAYAAARRTRGASFASSLRGKKHVKQQHAKQGTRLAPNTNAIPAKKLHVADAAKPIPKALMDPTVRRQLAKQKLHRPFFLTLMTLVHVGMMGFELYLYGGIDPFDLNPFLGPSTEHLITMGAKWRYCMRPEPSKALQADPSNPDQLIPTLLACPKGYPGAGSVTCTLSFYEYVEYACGMGGFAVQSVPDQWWRLITPLGLHVGVLHLLMNMGLQLRGVQMERQMGSLRMAIVYLLAGAGGNLFGVVMTDGASVGASSSLYGLYGLLALDLANNWPLLATPYRDAFVVTLQIVLAIGMGVVMPFVDNYAHVGGFVIGILAGLIVMPTIKFSNVDRFFKVLLRVIAIPCLLGLFGYGLWSFYLNPAGEPCEWCKVLNCEGAKIVPWCKSTSPATV